MCPVRILKAVPRLHRLYRHLSIYRPLVRWQSTEITRPASTGDKPYYVTTPIFYVNAAPHIGHLYTLILADIIKRWQILKGEEAILCTGVDEHGMKVQRAAAQLNIDTQSFCDQGAEMFHKLARTANISHDHFVRTTDSSHGNVVQYVWSRLADEGYIYLSTHEGWYSVSDETFHPKSNVQLMKDPQTGRTMMASKETGSEVEWISESNYFFRLSAFRERLLDFYRAHPSRVLPGFRTDEVVQHLEAGLEDLSISRPAQRLSWGVRVPGDETQTIYVWFDALINYLVKAGYPWAPADAEARGWPVDCHVVGKEIVRFHAVYWPAILMALGLPLPKRILAHAHWTLGHRKMSKSVGNVVNPFFAIHRFDADTIRFYMAYDGGISDDADYDNSFVIRRYKCELQNALGNLTSRITRGKRWNVKEAVQFGRRLYIGSGELQDLWQSTHIEDLPATVDGLMSDLEINRALQHIMAQINQTNKYLQVTSPWTMGADTNGEADVRVKVIVYLSAEALRVSGILLQPFMPDKAALLLDMLGVARDRRGFRSASFGADDSYGASFVDLGKGHQNVLFPPLRSDE